MLALLENIFAVISYLLKAFTKTSDQANQSIDQQVADEKKKSEESGRPE